MIRNEIEIKLKWIWNGIERNGMNEMNGHEMK